VEFRLLYEGEVKPSGGSNSRPAEKHEIRRAFHPQLRRLWLTNESVRQYAQRIGRRVYAQEIQDQQIQNPAPLSTDDAVQKAFAYMGANWDRSGYQCIPLATEKRLMRCSLDILLLRPGEDKYIFTQGDIDGQVKTLFDALRIPKTLEEAGKTTPGPDETPFFCLLEDDRMISEVRVTTDHLLLLPHAKQVTANDAFAVITVKLDQKQLDVFDDFISLA
jgi:hypothetical protein